MPTVNVNGARVRYTLSGRGAPLALLLPQSSGPAGRQALVDGLARGSQVLQYDQRGTGGSDPRPGKYSLAALAEDVMDLLAVLELGPCHLVCHSTGCGIGIQCAVRHPERIASLTLAAPWTHADPHLTTMQTLRKAAARALDPEQYARFNAALLFPPDFRRAHEAGFAHLAARACEHPQDPDDIALRLDAILAFDARTHLPAVRCPALVTVAADDQLMPSWFGIEAAAGIPNATYVELPGGGHMITETRTGDLLGIVSGFLTSL